MDFRNKWAVHAVRTLLALALLGIGGSGLYFVASGNIPPVEGETAAIQAAMAGLMVTGLLLVAKIIEVICGLMLIANFRPALAALLFAPISVAIIIYDVVLWSHVPSALIPAVFVFLANSYLGYVYWDKYRPIFEK